MLSFSKNIFISVVGRLSVAHVIGTLNTSVFLYYLISANIIGDYSALAHAHTLAVHSAAVQIILRYYLCYSLCASFSDRCRSISLLSKVLSNRTRYLCRGVALLIVTRQ